MRFQLNMACDNAAFAGDELYMETGRLVALAAERASDGQREGTMRDANGNTVGRWSFIEDQEQEDQ